MWAYIQELATTTGASTEGESLIHQFRHVIRIILVVSDYDAGFGETVAGRHDEAALEA